MNFNKSLRLAFCNFGVLIKSLFCQLVALAMFVAFAVVAFGDLAQSVVNAFQSNGVGDFLGHVVQSLVNGTFDSQHFMGDLEQMFDKIVASITSVANMWDSIGVSVIICVVVFLLYRVLVSFTDVAVGCQINEFMDSNASRPFSWFFFKKAGVSFGFVFLQLLLAIMFDTFIIAGSIVLAPLLMLIFGWWAIIPVFLLAIVLYSLRMSYMAFTLPSVVLQEDKKVGVAFREGLADVHQNFGKVFLHNFIILLIMTLLTGNAYLFTENRFIALAISAVVNFVLFFILKCVNFVSYYQSKDMPFFYKNLVLEGTVKYNKKQSKKDKRSKAKQLND